MKEPNCDGLFLVDLTDQYQEIAGGVVIGQPTGVQQIIGGSVFKSDRFNALLLLYTSPERCLLNNVATVYFRWFLWFNFTVHASVSTNRLQT